MTEHLEDFGGRFRRAREHAGLSLTQIADTTKLSIRNLRAVENNRIDQLPGGIYRRAIIRTFASEVGLDPEDTLRAFLARYPDDIPTWADLVPAKTPHPSWRVWQAVMSVLSALVPFAAGFIYFSLNTGDPTLATRPEFAGADVMQASLIPTSLPSRRSDDSLAMMVSVSAPTSLQIVADGREIVAGPLAAGQVLRLSLASDVVFVGDDAGAVHFSINGRAGRTLGESGSPLTARISRTDYQQWLMSTQ
jgi:cytoskeletal protein RodZ